MNEQRFACVDAYAAYIVMRAAYCAMDFGNANIGAYVQDCYEAATADDRLSADRCALIAAKLNEMGYRW